NSTQSLIESITKATEASNQSQQVPRILSAELKVPHSEKHQNEANAARQSIDNKLLLYVQIFGLLVVIAYTSVAAFQLEEMTKVTKASTDAAQTSAWALEENQRQFRLMFGQIKTQTAAQVKSGTAAGRAAKIAEDTLHVSERAYVTDGAVQLDIAKKVLSLPLINSGHIPSGNIDISLYEATFENPAPVSPVPMASIVERHHAITHLDSMIPGSPFSILIPVPNVSAELLNEGRQLIIVVGAISYNDGFPETIARRRPVCIQTIYQSVVKQFYWVPCDAAVELPKFESMDWTGLESTYPVK
ncbi:MAG: hypothetical protein WA474_10310, partial [Candidatus Sulfotelmatobacter sp.]